MNPFVSFSVTSRGYSHIAKGTVCEDSSAHYDKDELHIAIVADGHGDKTCFRSSTGSAIAVSTAMDNLKEFYQEVKDNHLEEVLFSKKEGAKMARQLCRSIIGNWTENVLADLEQNPPTDEEYASAGNFEPYYRRGEMLPHIYGTTLIATILTDSFLLVLHQGDGRCILVHRDGTIDQPVPWDDRCEGNMTTSLCDKDAIESCRYLLLDQRTDPVIACYVASDGVEDSFETQDEVNAFFGRISSMSVEHGAKGLTKILEEELPDFSRDGSRDDVSIAGIVDRQAVAGFAKKFVLISDLCNAEAEAKKATQRLDSMFIKHKMLKAQFEDRLQKYNAVKSACEELNSKIQGQKKILDTILLKVAPMEKQLEEAKKALETIRPEYENYMALHSSFEEKLKAAQNEAENLRKEIAAFVEPQRDQCSIFPEDEESSSDVPPISEITDEKTESEAISDERPLTEMLESETETLEENKSENATPEDSGEGE